MIIREARTEDITQIQRVRNSVLENRLSNPIIVSDSDNEEYINKRGKCWVSEIDNTIIGFSIVDLQDHNIWALFVHPQHEKQGVGKKLHDIMLDWYFTQTTNTAWLGTAPNTRAEMFYRKAGWHQTGMHGKGEIKFEMNFTTWLNRV